MKNQTSPKTASTIHQQHIFQAQQTITDIIHTTPYVICARTLRACRYRCLLETRNGSCGGGIQNQRGGQQNPEFIRGRKRTGSIYRFQHYRLVLEGAGAVGIAALQSHKVGQLGQNIALILSGANVDLAQFLRVA